MVLFNTPPLLYPQINHMLGDSAVYKAGEMVSRKTDQVGRDATTGKLFSNDEATFEKLQQAINSCRDLVQSFIGKHSPPLHRVIVPVLVVPTGRLWQVDYDADGSITTAPRQVNRASHFIDHAWPVGTFVGSISYRLSHIEIVTFDALVDTTKVWLGGEGFLPVTT